MVLETLDADALDRIQSRGHEKQFRKGEQIYHHGEPGASLLVVRDGTAEISITTLQGQKSILGLAGPGEVIGDIACLDGGPRSANVVALSALNVTEISRPEVLRFLREDTDSAVLVIEALCQKARNASEMFELKALSSGPARLALGILRLMEKEKNHLPETRLRVSQSWLGNYTGLTREFVNRQFKAWSTDGIARFESGEVIVDDVARLTEVAQSDG